MLQEFGPNEDVLSLRGHNIRWAPLAIEENLTKENFLFDERAGSDLKLLCPDRLPTALAEQPFWNTQVAVETRVNHSRKRAWSRAKNELDRNNRLSVPVYSTFQHTRSRSLCTAG